MPSSRGSFFRDQTCISCSSWIAGRFFTAEPTGKPTGYITLKSENHSVVSDSLQPHGLCSPWNSPGQNTGVSSLSLLQWIRPTQGSNPGLPHCRWILYQLSYQGSPDNFKVCFKVDVHISDISPVSNVCFTNIFSKSLGLSFHSLNNVFHREED